ncbi:SecY-interacting protein Syd [Oceanirhabdus sp. W0125-5]|uniref:SecY-interacting protein Syd n=1 Tax=Oceanirhabdus sp. W0125-5 TaxID=2999116 RepID=UPI0022F2E757|nr:SecY-interacting protein Syd [Oceanirhabdus sp. W0125-5]WBW96123.1 SecY-interacting protein Syd [Oceanirhabdus sp. W0125-5]
MKKEMKKYFNQLIEAWQGFNNSYPKVPWNDAVTSIIYEGEVDEDEYIGWKPIEKNVVHDFLDIENVLGVTFHESIKDYFNSYWFAELAGFYKSYNIILEPVLPGIELNNFLTQLIGYKEVHEGKLDNIPLGVEGRNSFLVVIDNNTGIVKLEDFETGRYEVISDSIEQLIFDIKLKA